MYLGHVNVSSDKLPAVLNTADALQIKGLEKTNELMAPYLRPEAGSGSRSSDRNLLSVPGPGPGRQPSTEGTPDYLQRSRSDAGYYPHRAHSAESRGHSFESRLEVARPKRVLTPPLSPAHSHDPISGNFARKKFRNRSENTSSSFSTSVEKSREESPGPASATKLEVTQSPKPESEASSYQSHETEHIAKKKRAMFSVNNINILLRSSFMYVLIPESEYLILNYFRRTKEVRVVPVFITLGVTDQEQAAGLFLTSSGQSSLCPAPGRAKVTVPTETRSLALIAWPREATFQFPGL